MATTIKLKNGSGAPSASDLVQGEPALDFTNNRLYSENGSGSVVEIGTNPSTLSIAGTAITATAAELNILDGVTSTAAELNILDGVTSTAAELNILDGVTSTTAELNILDGVTSTAAELNILDGVTSTTAELNILDGVTATTAELNILDGVTASTGDINYIDITSIGTVEASKAIVTDANKDITGGRNITISGELDAASLDISGNADIDGTLETDALSINGTAVTSTAAELNILDGVTSTAAELNILDGVTSTAAELNILDGVTSTTAELNILDGVTSTTAELNILDGVTSTAAELNILDGVTSTTAELNILDGVTATASELNVLDGVTAFVDEDDMSSNSATSIPSQQSVKAYVDATSGGSSTLAGLSDTNVTSPSDAALLFYDTGTSKWIDNVVSGDITIADTGVAAIGSGVIIDADVKSDAAIAISKTALVAGTGITLSTNTLNVDSDLAISGGTVNNTVIGGSTAAAGTFTTITANTSVVPDASDGATLGSASLEWSDLYLADGAVVYFGDDQDITLTHVADTGLTLKHANTADDKFPTFLLATGDTDIAINDKLGVINFQAPDEGAGTDAILVAAGIEAVSEGDFSASSNATSLVFKTASSEAAAEKARVDSSGNLLVAKTSANFTTAGPELRANGQINAASAGDFLNMYSTSASAYRFYVTNAGTINATATSISAISDQSLKENIRDLDKGLETINALQPRRFDWKNGDGNDIMGFIAQEVQVPLPELVHDQKYNESENKLAVKMGDMLPSMVKAIQELSTQVNELKAEVTALKGA